MKQRISTKTAVTEKPEQEERFRVQLDFSPEAYQQMQHTRKQSGSRTNAETVRNALRIYQWFLDKKEKGSRLQLVEDDGVKELELLF